MNDLGFYERNAALWWDARSRAFRSLRAVKAFHLERIARLVAAGEAPSLTVDLGCGGGLLAVPLSARVGRVVGVDLSAGSLRAARAQAEERAAPCRFLCGDLTAAPLASGCADLVLLSDVVEHLEDPAAAVAEAARLLRPGGRLYVNTINRTRSARFLAVTLAEGVGLVPRGTHDPRLFVAPEDLVEWARARGLRLAYIEGEAPRIARTLLSRAIRLRATASLAVSYSALFEKVAA